MGENVSDKNTEQILESEETSVFIAIDSNAVHVLVFPASLWNVVLQRYQDFFFLSSTRLSLMYIHIYTSVYRWIKSRPSLSEVSEISVSWARMLLIMYCKIGLFRNEFYQRNCAFVYYVALENTDKQKENGNRATNYTRQRYHSWHNER